VHVLFAFQLLGAFAVAHWDHATVTSSIEVRATILIGGYCASAVIGAIGLARRGLLRCAWALLLMPVYWLLLSLAAWRALFQLVRHPYRWEKTEHGLARTSRLASAAIRDSGAIPPQPLQAGASY